MKVKQSTFSNLKKAESFYSRLTLLGYGCTYSYHDANKPVRVCFFRPE